MKMNKKAVSPVIAVMLLVAVAVAAVGAYFIWYKSFQAGSQKNVEEQTGTIGSKLRVTNITNDNVTFYVTVKNATGWNLVATIGDIDEDAQVSIKIKDSNGDDHMEDSVTGAVGGDELGSANFTSSPAEIPIDEEGQFEAAGTADIRPGETYTIIITAAGVTTTEKYTAI